MAATALKLRCPMSECKTVEVVAPSGGYTAGQMVKIEDIVGVILQTTLAGALAVLIYEAPKIVVPCAAAATAGYKIGEKVYFTTNQVSETASGGTLCGIVTEDSSVGDTELEIHLMGALGITS